MKAHASPPQTDYPRKLYYKIREVARIAGVRPHVLRYWESEFTELKPEKDGSDQRRYRQRDIDVVLAIRQLLYEDGFTIKGARGRLRSEVRVRREGTEPAAAGKANGRADGTGNGKAAGVRENGASARPIGFRLASDAGRVPAGGAAIERDLTLLRGEVSDLLDLVRKDA